MLFIYLQVVFDSWRPLSFFYCSTQVEATILCTLLVIVFDVYKFACFLPHPSAEKALKALQALQALKESTGTSKESE